ncbi:MAG: TetR/AcrR family transcriptional regulator [Cytophagaceae bacterium]|nr:TetR/AcrR family transcriptional regulator [Cytophagaceae bacterium]MDW8455403.1 TetR/AcrR family transcriptional regulator [Cytophagaceae bacterium]
METDIKVTIIHKAGELFLKFGLKSISMDDIAKSLSISKKTIYKFFKNKDDLINSHVFHFIELQKSEILRLKKESNDPIHNLILISEYMKKNIINIAPALIHDLQKYHPKAWRIYVKFKRGFLINYISDTLEEGIQKGYFRQDIHPKIIAIIRLEEVETGFNTEVFPQNEFNTSEVQMQLFEHYIHGICTLKGHKLLNKYRDIIEDE